MKKTTITILFILIISITIGIFLTNNNVEAKTINVNNDGSSDYTRIQDAIDNSSSGDTIYVYSGTYYENIIINRGKSINLQGENKENTIIDGQKKDSVIFVNSDQVTISGFTIRNSGHEGSYPDYHAGINLRTHDITVSDNIIKNNYYGIITNYYDTQTYGYKGQRCDNLTIFDNTLNNNSIGINLNSAFYCEIYNNNIINHTDPGDSNTEGLCLELSGSQHCKIYKNLITDSIDGIDLYHASNNSIYLNEIINLTEEGFYIWPAYHNTIAGNTIKETDTGIHLDYNSHHNTIFLNNFIKNTDDIAQDYDTHNNKLDNGQYGNLWSNYEGSDKNNDGIGDTAYCVITSGISQDHESTMYDNYPLMNQWQTKFNENQIMQFINDNTNNPNLKEDTNEKKDNDGGIPGFEILTLISATILFIIYKKKKK